MRKQATLIVTIGLLGLAPAAQEIPVLNEIQKLVASDGAQGEEFGFRAVMEGETALVGAYREDDGGWNESGAAYVFTLEDGSWSERQKLQASDFFGGAHFGLALALQGDQAIIGAPHRRTDSGIQSAGGVYVFTRDSFGVWGEQQFLLPGGGQFSTEFGFAVALDGDTLVVGKPGDNVVAERSGSVFVFERVDDLWIEHQQLLPDDGGFLHSFGLTLALDEDDLFIGSPQALDEEGLPRGAAYHFVREGGTWTQRDKLLPSDGGNSGGFGCSMALEGSVFVVGAPGASTAYVFEREGDLWLERQQLGTTEVQPVSFGCSTAIRDGVIAVGAPGSLYDGRAVGSAHVFVRDDDGWTEDRLLLASDGINNDRFGSAVAITEETVIVGAHLEELSSFTSSSGSAYVFELSPEADTLGPRVLDASLSPNPVHPLDGVDLTALVDDSETGGSNVSGAELAIDGGPFEPLTADDGTFDSVTEGVFDRLAGLPDGTHEVCLRGIDALGNVGSETCLSLVVDGRPPTVKQVELSAGMIPVGGTTTLSALACDVDTGNSPLYFTCYRIDGGKEEPMVAVDGAFDSPTEEGTVVIGPFNEPGVYEVCVFALDVLLNISDGACALVTVFEPTGSFLAGHGTLETVDGHAAFGLTARYRRGSLTPKGRTEFRFEAPGLDFVSTTATVQSVSGKQARLGGTGTIGGAGGYGFQVTLRDADGPDSMGLVIWELGNGKPVYSNRGLTPLMRGSIAIRD